VGFVAGCLVLAGMAAVGHLLLRGTRLQHGLSAAGGLALAFLVGAGASTLFAFWGSLLAPRWALTATLGLIAIALLTVVARQGPAAWRERHRFSLPAPKLRLWAYPVGILVLLDAALLLQSVLRSQVGWDGLFVWGIKARYFFSSGGVPEAFFADPSREWSHIDYPFLLPLSEALLYRAAGSADERLAMLLAAAFVLCLLLLVYGLARAWRGPELALVACLVLLTVPATWVMAGQGLADLPLAVFLLAGGGLAARWFEDRSRIRDLLLAGLLLTLAVWVKREGLLAWAAAAAAVALWSLGASLRRRRLVWAPTLAYLAPALVLVPWLVEVSRHHLVDRSYARFGFAWLAQHADRLPAVVQTLGAELATFASWGVLWLLVAAAAVLKPPLRSPSRALLLWLMAAQLLSLPLIYTFSTWVPYTDHVMASIPRLVFQVMPLAVLFGVLSLPALRTPAGPAASAAHSAGVSPQPGWRPPPPDNLGHDS
jgi:dolichyl-phosphate-mannose-protein mannosyltransferase